MSFDRTVQGALKDIYFKIRLFKKDSLQYMDFRVGDKKSGNFDFRGRVDWIGSPLLCIYR